MEELGHNWKGEQEVVGVIVSRVILRGNWSLALFSVWLTLDGNILLHSFFLLTIDSKSCVHERLWLAWLEKGCDREGVHDGKIGSLFHISKTQSLTHTHTTSTFCSFDSEQSPLYVVEGAESGVSGKSCLSVWNFIISNHLDLDHCCSFFFFHLVTQSQAFLMQPCPSAACFLPFPVLPHPCLSHQLTFLTSAIFLSVRLSPQCVSYFSPFLLKIANLI